MPPEMTVLTRDLPAAPADPLHILPPYLPLLLGLALAALLVAIGVWLLAYHFSKQQRKSAPRAPKAIKERDSAADIRRLLKQYLASENYREGCHELSAVMKAHYGRATGLGVREMTVLEISLALQGPLVDFFRDLSARQFGRAAPTREEFEQACARALLVRKSKHQLLQRRGA